MGICAGKPEEMPAMYQKYKKIPARYSANIKNRTSQKKIFFLPS